MYIHFFKRVFDLIVALLALPFVLLAVCIFGPLIYFEDRGPIFYRARRIAKGGRPFGMLKFRSMKVDAPDIRLEDGSTYNGDDDPRVTRIGRFMRKTSVDEIPQFFNVLAGQMSLIGIRPDPLDWLERYDERERVILTVKPGITGYNQAYFRNSVDGLTKLKNDVYYAENISFALDLRIFFKTIKTVLFRENVNIDESRKNSLREFGSEHPAIILPDGYFENLQRPGREIVYLRSGREALLLVARNCKPADGAVILFPAYCCWSMSAPFEKSGWEIVYYRLNEDLTPDEEHLARLLESRRPDALLTMNFYGSAPTERAVALAREKRPEITVIEDFSHCTFCFERIFNPQVDFYVSSIRKSVGVCDGAIIIGRKPIDTASMTADQTAFSDMRAEAQSSKGRYFHTKDPDAKQSFLNDLRRCETQLDDFDRPHPMSDRAHRMLACLNGEEIAFARRENMKHLLNELERGGVQTIPGLKRSLDGAPFSLPVLVERRDEVQRELARNGVYAPVLWPLCDRARETCPVSARMADRMLSLPVDQRYGRDDMEEIARIVISCKR